MSTLISEAEKTIKKLKKEGLIEILDNKIIDDMFDEVEEDMEDYRIKENYRKGSSLIDANKILINFEDYSLKCQKN